jgi:hypothetical protein
MRHTEVRLNAATGGAGGEGTAQGAGGDARGGGLYLGLAAATFDHDVVTGNRALGGVGTPAGGGFGGGVYINVDGTALFSKTQVKGNFASTADDDIFDA